MSDGELLTRWTVRVALAFYVAALALRLRGAPAVARFAWTAGCLAFLAHTACAFAFYHGWSHAAAVEATARRTREVVGLDWGGGLWANYLFALVWLLDAGWWWLDARGYRQRSRWVEVAVQGFLGFIALNATVVFGAGVARWGGLAAAALLAALALRRQASRGR